MNAKLDGQLVALAAQIEAEQANYKAAVALAVHGVLAHYGLTADDLLATTKPLKKAVKKAVSKPAKKAAKKAKPIKGNGKGTKPPKYRDPDSGATWSGYGHAPAWIASASDRAPFLIPDAA